MITCADNMARLPPFMEIFASACGAAKSVFAVIDRQSEIDSLENDGQSLDPSKIKGNIEFKDVFFNYSSRPDVQVKWRFNQSEYHREILKFIKNIFRF